MNHQMKIAIRTARTVVFLSVSTMAWSTVTGASPSEKTAYVVKFFTDTRSAFSSDDGRVTVLVKGTYPDYSTVVSDHGIKHGLDTPSNASEVYAVAANNNGTTVGNSSPTGGYMWDAAGAGTNIRIHPRAVNNNGTAAGSASCWAGCFTAALWRNGALIQLEPPPWGQEIHYGTALDINDAEVAVGSVDNGNSRIQRAYRWENGDATVLPSLVKHPPPLNEDAAQAINMEGLIVGSSTNATGATRAVLWQDGQIQDLGDVEGRRQCKALAINSTRFIVGTCYGLLPGDRGNAIATLWQDGQKMDLNSFLDQTQRDEWTLFEANEINDRGDISGTAVNKINQTVAAFVLKVKK